jgi:hypothetical protein
MFSGANNSSGRTVPATTPKKRFVSFSFVLRAPKRGLLLRRRRRERRELVRELVEAARLFVSHALVAGQCFVD